MKRYPPSPDAVWVSPVKKKIWGFTPGHWELPESSEQAKDLAETEFRRIVKARGLSADQVTPRRKSDGLITGYEYSGEFYPIQVARIATPQVDERPKKKPFIPKFHTIDEKAASRLAMADHFVEAKRWIPAARRYEELIEDYPATAASEEASRKLAMILATHSDVKGYLSTEAPSSDLVTKSR